MSRPVGRTIGPQTRQIAYNLYSYLKQRKHDPTSEEYQNDVNLANLVAEITRLSKGTVRNIISQGKSLSKNDGDVIFKPSKKKKPPKKRIAMDSVTEELVLRKAKQFYTENKEPNLRKFNDELKQEGILTCSREYLRHTLHRLGFKFENTLYKGKCDDRADLNKSNVTSLRRRYILAIKKYRDEDRPIFYIDGTYVNQSHTVKDEEFELFIVHAGGQTGFVKNGLLMFKSHSKSGDYHKDMNSDNFKNWIKDQLLPNVPNNSVIVIAAHCEQIDRKPSTVSSKKAMQDWLTRHNVSFEQTMRRCDLMSLIKSQKLPKEYTVDVILSQNGHTVLRLPPEHPYLNPMEMVWGDIKAELAKNCADSNLDEIKHALTAFFANYSAEKWQRCYNHLIRKEEKYSKEDRICDGEFDRSDVTLNDDSHDSGESSESDDAMAYEDSNDILQVFVKCE